jgi:hypothetical protein
MKVVKFLEDQEVGGKLRVGGEIRQVRDSFPEDGVEVIKRDVVNSEVGALKRLREKPKPKPKRI